MAIETLRETNQKITSLIQQHRADASLKVDPLGMVLNGVVDAAVSGGIANYKVIDTVVVVAVVDEEEILIFAKQLNITKHNG